jgi:hypothetical protein
MSGILTVPLLKSFPILKTPLSQSGWGKIFHDFLLESQKDISVLITDFNKNIEILEHQKNQTSVLIAILEECGGLTVRARNKMTTPEDKEKFQKEITEFEAWFIIAMGKLDKAVQDSSYQNVNLMNGETLVTPLDGKGHKKLIAEGLVLTSASLGIRNPDFSSTFSVQNSRIDIMNAIDMVVTMRNIISSHIASLKIGTTIAIHSIDLAKTAQSDILDTNLLNESKSLLQLKTDDKNILGSDPLAEPAQQEILINFASSKLMEDI